MKKYRKVLRVTLKNQNNCSFDRSTPIRPLLDKSLFLDEAYKSQTEVELQDLYKHQYLLRGSTLVNAKSSQIGDKLRNIFSIDPSSVGVLPKIWREVSGSYMSLHSIRIIKLHSNLKIRIFKSIFSRRLKRKVGALRLFGNSSPNARFPEFTSRLSFWGYSVDRASSHFTRYATQPSWGMSFSGKLPVRHLWLAGQKFNPERSNRRVNLADTVGR